MVRVSNAGVLEIAELEGIVPAPYLDTVADPDVWTFGIGHTNYAGEPNPADMPKGMPVDVMSAIDLALKVLALDLTRIETRIIENVRVPLEQHQVDALASVDLNTGFIKYRDTAGFMRNATAIQLLNRGDYEGAADAFMNWTKPAVLKARRAKERALFLTGDYAANGDSIPVYNVDAAGKLRGLYKTMKGSELLERMRESEGPLTISEWLKQAPPGALKWLRNIPDGV